MISLTELITKIFSICRQQRLGEAIEFVRTEVSSYIQKHPESEIIEDAKNLVLDCLGLLAYDVPEVCIKPKSERFNYTGMYSTNWNIRISLHCSEISMLWTFFWNRTLAHFWYEANTKVAAEWFCESESLISTMGSKKMLGRSRHWPQNMYRSLGSPCVMALSLISPEDINYLTKTPSKLIVSFNFRCEVSVPGHFFLWKWRYWSAFKKFEVLEAFYWIHQLKDIVQTPFWIFPRKNIACWKNARLSESKALNCISFNAQPLHPYLSYSFLCYFVTILSSLKSVN